MDNKPNGLDSLPDFDNMEEIPEGVITNITMKVMREYLGVNAEKWSQSVTLFPKNVKTRQEKEDYIASRLDSSVIVIEWSIPGGLRPYTSMFTNPTTQSGYQQSNIRKVRMANGYPADMKLWIGKPIKLTMGSKKFLEPLE